MAGARPILSIVSLILLAGGILLSLFVILSGAVNGGFENRIYFLQADTSGIPGAPNPARWTFFSLCGTNSAGHSSNCGPIKAALPFNPPGDLNFGTNQGVPSKFTSGGLGKTTYYLSRSMFAFYFIALFFAVCALFLSLAALFARLGAYLAGMTTFLAMFFQALTAALMTSWTVLGKKAFQSNNSSSDNKLGTYAYGFTWASFACFFLATVLFCAGGKASSSQSSSGGGGFKRNRSVKSNRGSFYGSEDGGGRRGVKDEYD